MSTSRTQTSKPQQPSFFGCCGVLMNPFALRERRQILCSRRWFRELKNFSWRYSLAATVLLLSPFDLLASLGMDMYLPAVPFMPNALGTTASTIQLTLTTYLVMIGAGQLLFGPLSDRLGRRPFYWEVASPTLWRQWPRSYVIG